MASLDGKAGYSALQILLHWLIAALVFFQLIFGESIGAVLRAQHRGTVASGSDIAFGTAHYWVGIAILLLVLLRIVVRVGAGAPQPAVEAPAWTRRAAHVSHALFYLLLVVTPLLGLAGYYFGEPFDDIHSAAKPVFIVLIALHVLGALYHQLWLKDGTLRRMVVPA